MLRADGRCGLDILLGGNAVCDEIARRGKSNAKFECRVGAPRLIHSAELAVMESGGCAVDLVVASHGENTSWVHWRQGVCPRIYSTASTTLYEGEIAVPNTGREALPFLRHILRVASGMHKPVRATLGREVVGRDSHFQPGESWPPQQCSDHTRAFACMANRRLSRPSCRVSLTARTTPQESRVAFARSVAAWKRSQSSSWRPTAASYISDRTLVPFRPACL